MEKFTTLGDRAVHYKDSETDGIPVVLLHGYLESLDVWDSLAAKLSRKGIRTISLDLPGHGISEVTGPVHTMEFLADTVHDLLDKLGVEKAVLIGHSMGGYAALAFAKKYPDRLSGLVLFHSTPNADTEEKKNDRMREVSVVQAGKKELLARTLPQKGFNPDNVKRLHEEIEGLSLQVMLTEDEGITALLKGMSEREDTNEMLKALAVPQLFLFGCKDNYIPVSKAEEIARNHPQARTEWLSNSGHMGFLEEPERSLEIISNFVSSL